jgi:hypothetical protein
MLLPPRRYAVAGQFAGVVAGIQVDKALVLSHIVETVGDYHTSSRAAKVVVVGLNGLLSVNLAVSVEIAQQFPLLRVHADDRQAGAEILLLEMSNVLELGVAMGMVRTHCLLLQRLSPPVSVFAEQLGSKMSSDRSFQPSDPACYLPSRQANQFHLSLHRIAGGMVP